MVETSLAIYRYIFECSRSVVQGVCAVLEFHALGDDGADSTVGHCMTVIRNPGSDPPASDNPACSICIANYNGLGVIGPCLESVFSQVFGLPFEVIVHDDASRDGSVSFIRERFPQVKLIESDRNVGFCVSNNRMVAQAKGQYILLLNNDATLHADALATLHETAESLETPSILGLPQYNMCTKELIDIGSLFDMFLNPIPNRNAGRHHVGMVIGACFWIPKVLWEELGGFPEWFGNLAEDMYLCCLARLRGYPVLALARSGFNHVVGASLGGGKIVGSGLHTTYRRRSLSERNKTFVMIMCYPAPYAWFLIPLHLFLLALEGVSISLLKKDIQPWKIIYWPVVKSILADYRPLIIYRSHIQSTRILKGHLFFSPFNIVHHKISMFLKYGLPKIY